MAVTKFRTPDEASSAQRSAPGSDANVRRMRAILEFWSHARPRKVPRGVFKYRSIEEANAALSRR